MVFGMLREVLLTMLRYMLGESSIEAFYGLHENEDGEEYGGISNEEAGVILLVIYSVIAVKL